MSVDGLCISVFGQSFTKLLSSILEVEQNSNLVNIFSVPELNRFLEGCRTFWECKVHLFFEIFSATLHYVQGGHVDEIVRAH